MYVVSGRDFKYGNVIRSNNVFEVSVMIRGFPIFCDRFCFLVCLVFLYISRSPLKVFAICNSLLYVGRLFLPIWNWSGISGISGRFSREYLCVQ